MDLRLDESDRSVDVVIVSRFPIHIIHGLLGKLSFSSLPGKENQWIRQLRRTVNALGTIVLSVNLNDTYISFFRTGKKYTVDLLVFCLFWNMFCRFPVSKLTRARSMQCTPPCSCQVRPHFGNGKLQGIFLTIHGLWTYRRLDETRNNFFGIKDYTKLKSSLS